MGLGCVFPSTTDSKWSASGCCCLVAVVMIITMVVTLMLLAACLIPGVISEMPFRIRCVHSAAKGYFDDGDALLHDRFNLCF